MRVSNRHSFLGGSLLIALFLIIIGLIALPSPIVYGQGGLLIESNDAQVAREGTWASQAALSASGGSYLYNTSRDAALTLEFAGPSVEVRYLTGPSLGTLAVEVDGTVLRTVITTDVKTQYGQSTSINYLTDETHTLRVYAQEGGVVAIDAFVVAELGGINGHPPADPGPLVVRPDPNDDNYDDGIGIIIEWDDNSDNETRFEIEESPDGVNDWVRIGETETDVFTFVLTLPPGTVGCWRVVAIETFEGVDYISGYSNIVCLDLRGHVPATPTNLVATAVSSSQINVTWTDAANNETAYHLERSLDGTTGWAEIAVLPTDTTNYANTGLAAATRYWYRVRAADGIFFSPYSNIDDDITPPTGGVTPATPTNLVATAFSSSQINVTWTDAATNETGYHLERSLDGVGGWTEIAVLPANTTNYPNTGLAAATRYWYRVRAVNSGTFSAYSNIDDDITPPAGPVTPAVPTNLIATAASSSQIDVTWTDNATNETAYHLERSLDGVGGWAEIAVLPANSTSYPNTGLAASTRYWYRVRAVNISAFSAYSNIDDDLTHPATPTNLVATAYSMIYYIDVTWQDNAIDETAYRLERSPNGTSGWTEIANLPAGTTSYRDNNIPGSTRYHYRARAYRASDDRYSAYSNVDDALTPPAAPVIDALTIVRRQIDVEWTDNSPDEAAFIIETSLTGTGGWSQLGIVAVNGTIYHHVGLNCVSTHHYRVWAFRSSDNFRSVDSNTDFDTTTACQPSDTIALFRPDFGGNSVIDSIVDMPPLTDYVSYTGSAPVNGAWVMGDWNGDGQETPGVAGGGAFYYTNAVGPRVTWEAIWVGFSGLPAVAGRFRSDVNHDCIGMINSDVLADYTIFAMYFYCDLTNNTSPPYELLYLGGVLPDNSGFTGAHQFVVGDYNNDGIETVAARRSNWIAISNTPPALNSPVTFAAFPDAQMVNGPETTDYGILVAGDWNNDNVDSFAIFYTTEGHFYYRNDLTLAGGPYTLQRVGQPIGVNVTVNSWH